MKNSEINKLTPDEINTKINSIKKDLFNFRFRKVNSQLEDTSKITILKKDIAKLLTKLSKKK
jgi:large subunit ribosomal protein L29|tara:strand:+ start:289 stop:474 length:186 start_codon:yes stop_codon:yes gene_type:complete